jgi:hypothetical protein
VVFRLLQELAVFAALVVQEAAVAVVLVDVCDSFFFLIFSIKNKKNMGLDDILGLEKAEKSLDSDLTKGLDGLQRGLGKDLDKMDDDLEDLEKTLDTDLAGMQKQMLKMTEEIKDIATHFQQIFENVETQSEKSVRKVGGVMLAGAGVVLYMNSSDPVFSTAGALCALMGISFILN